jgi:PTS system fructose-specific IIC component
MMCTDMGGPVNKAAYAFGVGLLSTQTYAPMAAIMAAGMVPPLALGLATLVARRKFDKAQQEGGKAALVLGLCFITEGLFHSQPVTRCAFCLLYRWWCDYRCYLDGSGCEADGATRRAFRPVNSRRNYAGTGLPAGHYCRYAGSRSSYAVLKRPEDEVVAKAA